MRYIEVDKIIAQIKAEHCDKCKHNEQCAYCDIDKVLLPFEEAPEADVVEAKHGEWKKQQFVGRCGIFSIKDFLCGECGESFEVGQGKGLMHFCPNCGAKMDERKGE